eukprot:gene7225-7991_t
MRGSTQQQVSHRSSRPNAFSQQQQQQQVQVTTTTTTLTNTSTRTPTSRPQLIFSLVQDVSGSMSGSKIDASLQGLNVLYEEVFQPTDLLGVVTFANEVKVLHRPMIVDKIDRDRDSRSIRAEIGGGTALYDAIGQVIQGIIKDRQDPKHRVLHKQAVYELVIITDGEDNCSTRYTLDQIAALVAEPGIPHFHLTILGVDINASYAARITNTLCSARHVKYLDVANAASLGEAIRNVGHEIVQRVTISFTATTIGSGSGGSGGVSPSALLAAVQAMNINEMPKRVLERHGTSTNNNNNRLPPGRRNPSRPPRLF